MPAALGVVERGEGSAVVVAEDLGPLEELVLLDHVFERGASGEVVLAAVRLGAAWRAGGEGDGEVQTLHQRAELADQGRLSGPGRSGDDEEDSSHTFVRSVTAKARFE